MNDRLADPITTEVIRNFLTSCAEDMNASLFRSAFSPVIYEGRDCAVAILDEQGRTLGQSVGVPLFLGNLEECVQIVLRERGSDYFEPGDVVAMNDPYIQGTHTNDVTVFAPIFWRDQLVSFAATRAHWLDVGGKDPGLTMSSTDVYQEGFRLGPTKVFRRYEPVDEWTDFLARNSRFPDLLLGDLNAQVAACRTGEQRYRRMLDRFGWEVFAAARDDIFRQCELLDREAITAIPDGVYTAEGYMDDDGLGSDPILIRIRVEIDGDRFLVDFDGSAPRQRGPINCGRVQTISAVRMAHKMLVNTQVATTGGTFPTLEVAIPDDCVLNASEPVGCTWYFSSLGLLIDLVVKALAPVLPDQAAAAHYGDSMVVQLTGKDPRSKDASWLSVEPTAGGWGAFGGGDGESALINSSNGAYRNIPVEVFEAKYPVRIERFALRPDSGGPGRWRGGCGVERVYVPETDVRSYLWFERSQTPAWGLFGAKTGAPPEVVVEGSKPRSGVLKVNDEPLDAGDRLILLTGGGGGWEQAYERPPDEVAEDVADGYVTLEGAARDYGVEIDPSTGDVDHDATAHRRRPPRPDS